MSRCVSTRCLVVSILGAGVLAGALWTTPTAALESAERYIFVPNRVSSDVAVIDSQSQELVARVRVGKVPHQVAVSDRLGKIVASNTGDDTISIIDLETLRTEATLVLGHEPEHMQIAPGGELLAVGNIGAGTVSLVSLAQNRELARVEGLFQPHNLTFSPDGKRLFVANLGADHVSVIDVAEGRVVKEIPVAEPTPLAARVESLSGEFQGIINVTRSLDGRLGFAAHGEGNTLAVIDLVTGEKLKSLELGELPWRAYATADGRFMLVPNNGDGTVSVVSTSSLEVVATLPGAADVTGVNTDNAGTTAFVLSRGEGKVVVLDLVGMKKAGEIALPGTPETGVSTPQGQSLYVALGDTDQVAVIDMATRKMVKTIDDIGDGPWGATMAGAGNYCH